MNVYHELKERDSSQEAPAWALPLALILFALVLLLVGHRYAAPAPKDEDAPAEDFSAGRAHLVLRGLLGDEAPHPVGSAANVRVRDRILAELRRMGYAPEVQSGFACNQRSSCARVENVIARVEGREPGAAVMLAAHYDSAGAGPGASDDLAGVAAVLEIARILKAGPPPRRPVVLLLDDGEEAGLLGAEVFIAEHPLARQVRAVVNLEARGTSGPSLMFETSENNGWLIPLFAAAERPVTSSLFETIYDRLPNDTDFTVFERAGIHGFNLAFIGDPAHYHTHLDNFASSSPATLQHQGDNALAALRALAEADLPEQPQGDAVFFDVLSLGLVWWPETWTLGLAALAALLLVVGAVRLLRRRALTGGSLAWGFLAWLGMLLAAGLAGMGLAAALRAAGVLRIPWAAHPSPFQAAFWTASLAVVGTVAALASRRAGLSGFFFGVWTGWSVLGLALAATLPGVSYLFLVPALAAGGAGLLLARSSSGTWTFAALLPALVAAVLWFPLLFMVYDGMGSMILTGIGLSTGLVFSGLTPLVPSPSRVWRRGIPVAAAVAIMAFTVLAVSLPLHSADSPQFLNILFHQDADTGKARWIVLGRAPLPPELEKVAAFGQEREKAFPWSSGANARVADAPPIDVSGPELMVLSDASVGGKRQLRVRLRSTRGASNVMLVLPKAARVESFAVEGKPVPARDSSLPEQDWSFYFLAGLPPEGMEIDLVLGETSPQTWYLSDDQGGLPPAGAAFSSARPATVTTFHEGDETIVSRSLRI